jgi:hypothetical protein
MPFHKHDQCNLFLTDILLSYREVSRETVISSAPNFYGHRTIRIQFDSPIHKKSMPNMINENFDELCKITNVNQSLINSLYSKGVIDVELSEELVRLIHKYYTFSAKFYYFMGFRTAIPRWKFREIPEAFQTL